MKIDKVTELARKSINILFVSNPRGTSIGILIGIVLDGIIGVFYPSLHTIAWINVSALKVWHLIGLGVILMNLPSYLRRKEVDPTIINAIEFIEKQKEKGNIKDLDAKLMYKNLHTKVLESVALRNKEQDTADQINSLISQPKSGQKRSK